MGQLTLTRKRWHAFRDRCDNPKNDSYYNYGSRGISYDPSWKSYDQFLADMGKCPVGFVLDRIDNDKGYSKENCRWVTKADSAKNRRTTIVSYEQAKIIKAMARAKNPKCSMLKFSTIVSEAMGLTTSLVRDIARGKSWVSI